MPPKRAAATKAAAESKAKANGAGPSKPGAGTAKVDKVSGDGEAGGDGPAGPAKKKQRTKKEAAVDDAEEESTAKSAAPASPKKGKAQKKSHPKGEDEQEAKSGEPAAATAAAAAAHPSAPPPGGAKMDTTAPEELPRNTSVPDPLSFEGDEKSKKQDGDVRIASWNVTSFKSVLTKGFMRYVEAEQADVLFLSETKCNDVPMHPRLSEIYPYQAWGIGLKKGYGGVALLSKQKPLKVTTGLATSAGEDSPQDTKGRLITAEFSNYILAGTYVVNAGEGLKTMPQKQAWNAAFARHLKECDERKPTIWTGDLNVVLDSRDLSAASKKWNKSPGYTAIECSHHRAVLAGTAVEGAKPYVDMWRELHPDAVGHYSYYGYRGNCRVKGIGWRLDSFIVPERIKGEVRAVEIRHSVWGASDHTPVYMDIKGPL